MQAPVFILNDLGWDDGFAAAFESLEDNELVVFERLERGREAVVPAEVVQSEQWCLQARSPSGSSDGPDVARGSELATEVCCG